jgi:hypothetical protein
MRSFYCCRRSIGWKIASHRDKGAAAAPAPSTVFLE